MKKYRFILLTAAMVSSMQLFTSCGEDFLEKPAIGALSEDVIANEAGVEKLLIGAYAALDAQGNGAAIVGGGQWEAAPTNWIYGSVAGGEAHKGSSGSDQPAINSIATFITDPSNGFLNTKWRSMYEGISRTNATLRLLEQVDDMSDANKQRVEAEARFLRGHYYFELKKMFNMVPWIDETTTDFNQPNNVDIWPNIEADFQFAYQNLPNTQAQVGRANKWAAGAYLGKTYLYQHKYTEAKTVFDEVISSGVTSNGLPYGLVDRFKDNFDAANENNEESVFAIQMVANDGTNTIANGNQGEMLNYPYNSPFRCCGFYQPTIDLANSYRTNAQGLPYLDNYNATPIRNDQGITSSQAFTPDDQPVDPRLDWTVGRRGIPFLDWGPHPGQAWIREQSTAGPYSSKKHIYWQATADTYSDQSSWAPGSAINVLLIRFADVLLMAAEVEAQLGNFEQAQEYVNRVRARAANPENIVHEYVDPDEPLEGFTDEPAANYNVAPYPAGYFAGLGQAGALDAIYFERKLELALEGHRFFDLVRWGIAAEELNAYFDYEGAIVPDVRGAQFEAGTHEYYPIPQRQIDLQTIGGESLLTQNPGYN
ncbi:RagB/SusD family nutrient uptake outer membrane protein [Pontibacter diazotrophicus]|uniref:RagB/SusD family nutrient uptake outer membrane protein n=1 Tax=Pontibacter diazotrophicus TaxID=1400979 RepID=A0A3D8LCB4_9BACT|nr:RagB/SusD family nutrient uptake outer membrane protein [Pontibacter diazotrophicus]RDV15079.1 RagB/SusD family nutrient uptake outer membrane protein [Pontibacter diazotrophicus]